MSRVLQRIRRLADTPDVRNNRLRAGVADSVDPELSPG
jgi:hypothetical protein